MYHAPLTWYEQQSLGHSTLFCLADGTVGFASLHVVSWSQRHCASVLQAGSRVHKSHNSALLRSLSNSTSRHKRNVLILRIVAWCSLAVAGACYVLNRIDIGSANVKFPPSQHTKYRSADKSLALPGRKQVNISVRLAWISFGALPCRGKELDGSSRIDVVEITRVPLYTYIYKAVPLQPWTGPEVSRGLMLPD